jgi:trans-aconitate 2-methyltransferase
MTGDGWDPGLYHRFREQRRKPFVDLLASVQPVPGGRAVDLGCGTGELTVELHRATRAAETLGVDSSPAMLDQARDHAGDGVRFEAGDLAVFEPGGHYDVVFSNAALQWVPDHAGVLARWTAGLPEGAQLAVQVPANPDHPAHQVADEVAREAPFAAAFGGEPPADPLLEVLTPAGYATLLDELGYRDQHVRLQVYGLHFPTTADVAEWTRGTALTRFRRALPPDLYDRFVDRYRARLVEVAGDHRPYFYPFKRILLWARR